MPGVPGGIPEAPEWETVVPQSSSEVALSWTDVVDETRYRLQRRSGDAGAWIVVVRTLPGNTTANDVGLASGTTYSYRVIAISVGTQSSRSEVISVTTPPLSPSLSVELGASSDIALTWDDVAGETSYRIERSTDGATWTPIDKLGQDATQYVDTGLLADVTYSYRIFAMNAGGDSAASNVGSVTTSPSAPPAEAPPAEVTDAPSPTGDGG